VDKNIRSYTENGNVYRFEKTSLDMLINRIRKERMDQGKATRKKTIIFELADHSCVSEEAVKNWLYGINGPVDLEQVKKIADYFKVDYHELLKQEDKMSKEAVLNIDNISDELRIQIHASVSKVYSAIVEALDNVWDYYAAEKKREREDYYSGKDLKDDGLITYEEAEASVERARKMFSRYYLDIPKSLYEKSGNWFMRNVSDELFDITCYYVPIYNENNPEEAEIREEFCNQMKNDEHKFEMGIYHEELKELFSEFVLNM